MINWEKLDNEQLKDHWEKLEDPLAALDLLRGQAVRLLATAPGHRRRTGSVPSAVDRYDAPEGEGDPNDAIHWHEALYAARDRWREIGKSCFGGDCARAEVDDDDQRGRTREQIEELLRNSGEDPLAQTKP